MLIFRTWLYTLASHLGVVLLGLLINVIVARTLGPEGRGLLGWAMLVATLAAGIAQLGLGQACVYFKRTQADWCWKQLLSLACMAVITIAVILACIGSVFSENAMKVSSLSLACIAGALAINGLLLNVAQLDVSLCHYNQARLIGPALYCTGLSFILINGNLTVPIALWIQFAATAVASFFLLFSVRNHFCQRDVLESDETIQQQIAKLSVHALKFHGVVLLGMLVNNIDKLFLLITSSSLASFGLYTVAYTSSRLIGSIQETMSTTLYSRYAGDKSITSGQGIYLAFRISFAPMLFLAFALGSAGSFLLGKVFGESFSHAGSVFAILLIECIIGNSSYLLAQQFNAIGRPGAVLVRQIVSLLPLAIFLPFVPSTHLLEGIALLLLLSALVRLITTIFLLKFLLGMEIPDILPSKNDLIKLFRLFGAKV